MRLIDANELLNELEKVRCSLQMNDNTQRADLIMSGLYVAKRHIQEVPTVDAVPVIRCKDCRYNADCVCVWHSGNDYTWVVDDDDYCSCAEPKKFNLLVTCKSNTHER